jgi:hypothetical protein
MWQHLNIHVSEHGPTKASSKAFVERRLVKRHTRCNTLIVPINDSQHWSLMILKKGMYYHMNPKPDYDPHNNISANEDFVCKMLGNYAGQV